MTRMKTLIFNTITYLERERFNLITGALWFTFVVFLRIFVEFSFFSENPGIYVTSIYDMYHQFAFYLVMFVFGLLIMVLFSGEKIKKVANIVLISFPIILIAPLIDKFVFGRTELYYYARPEAFFENLQTLFLQSRLAPGIAVQLAIILLFACFYVFIKTLMLNKSSSSRRTVPLGFGKSVLALICFYFVIGIIGTMPVFLYHQLLETGYFTVLSLKLILFICLFIFGIFVLIVIINIANPKILMNLVKNLDKFSVLYLVALAGLGTVANGLEIFNSNTQEALVHVSDSPYAFTAALAVAFGSVSAFYVRKFKETNTLKLSEDGAHIKSSLNVIRYRRTALLMAYTCFGLSLLLGPVSTLLCTAFLILMWFYPQPIKTMREKIWRSFILSLGSCLAFLIGYFTTNIATGKYIGDYVLVLPDTRASPTLNVFFMGIAILCISIPLFLLRLPKNPKKR